MGGYAANFGEWFFAVVALYDMDPSFEPSRAFRAGAGSGAWARVSFPLPEGQKNPPMIVARFAHNGRLAGHWGGSQKF